MSMQETRSQTSMGKLWNSIQSWLFPVLEDELGVKDEPAAPPPDPTRLQQQLERDLQANLADAAYDAKAIREWRPTRPRARGRKGLA